MSVIVNIETHEIVVEVDYQEKGDRGPAFTFEDFTEDEILKLQQPAIDGAIVALYGAQEAERAAQGANNATAQSVGATNAAITATENANSATQSADDAADLANTATENATQATSDANTATTNATTAATAATNAAALANSAKGWTPLSMDEAFGDKIIRKVTGYLGGTGDEPTDNVGMYFTSDGTFTAIKEEAQDYRGQDGETIVNINPNSPTSSARIWIGTQDQYDAQQPLPEDVLIFILG